MMMAILLAAATPHPAIEAERAFAAMAQERGQWTAFRAFAAEDATIFAPQPIEAQTFLKPLKDPPKSIEWSPSAAYVSCDGATAATTGPWKQPDGSVGFFSTVWLEQPDGGWKWAVDGGDELKTARPAVAEPPVETASCKQAPIPMQPPTPAGSKAGGGASRDRSLLWRWVVAADGGRRFTVKLWTGEEYRTVIDDRIAPAPTPPAKP